MTRSRWTLLALLGVLAAGCGGDGPGRSEDAESTLSPEAPPLALVTLEGDSVTLAGLRGAPVLLNVWATWCAPCRQEIPELQEIHETFGPEGLRVVGVTVDSRSAGEDVRAFIAEFGMTYDIWWDPDQTSVSRFEAIGVPLTVLIGPEGRIRWRHMGVLQPGDAALREAIRAVL
ncbi:MAG TPA: TlpA disulfide reductase family protein [Longimicrobiales bacterium]|nr:TlpA disulfide reductase family protein [Longimicrobiales bacterium]